MNLKDETAKTETVDKTKKSQELDMLLEIKDKISFFKELSDAEILSLVGHAEFIRLKKGELLFNQGELGNEVFFIINGSVDISVHEGDVKGHTVLSTLTEGSSFGEIAPVLGETRSATAITSGEDNFILMIRFIDSPDEQSALAYIKMTKNFIRVLSEKLIGTNELVYNLGHRR